VAFGWPRSACSQRRYAERPVLVCEQPGPGSQIVEELVEHRVEGVRLGDSSVSLLHVQNPVNDLAEHLVEGGGRIVAPGRTHADTDAAMFPLSRYRKGPPASARARTSYWLTPSHARDLPASDVALLSPGQPG
jgi:hypothetical protein